MNNFPLPAPPARQFLVEYENRSDYLCARVTGSSDSLEITISYWREVAEQCRIGNVSRLMLVDDLEGEPLSPGDLAQFVGSFLGSPLHGVKIAFVEPRVQNMASVEHGEVIAAEHGFNARVFAEAGVAENWLRYGGD